ncbi:MAG: Biopolymer transport protein ExbD [Verrucomicrobiales bacterium]|nr:Biopolymer transport protein ExbD [Verrucomicrobiales bacterium]
MQFVTRKRHQAPTVIIISLIDILIVLLIFLMVTTTFKQVPSVKLTLPESKPSTEGVTATSLVVTVAKQEPFFYIEKLPVTYPRLQDEIKARVAKDPKLQVSIRAGGDTQWSNVVRVMSAAKSANAKSVVALTKSPGK